MKKTLFSTIASALVLILVSNTANAQTVARLDATQGAVKEVSTSAAEVEVPNAEALAPSINEKVTRSLSKSFSDASPKWYLVDGNYLARFTANGNVTHALYKKNGYMLYSVTKGPASLLPKGVAKLIGDNYPDYEISAATQAISLGTTAWIDDLKQCNNLVIAKVINSEIVESTLYRTPTK
jgi:hypothetical protein